MGRNRNDEILLLSSVKGMSFQMYFYPWYDFSYSFLSFFSYACRFPIHLVSPFSFLFYVISRWSLVSKATKRMEEWNVLWQFCHECFVSELTSKRNEETLEFLWLKSDSLLLLKKRYGCFSGNTSSRTNIARIEIDCRKRKRTRLLSFHSYLTTAEENKKETLTRIYPFRQLVYEVRNKMPEISSKSRRMFKISQLYSTYTTWSRTNGFYPLSVSKLLLYTNHGSSDQVLVHYSWSNLMLNFISFPWSN